MPYKHIAAHLKKTELACRLHYHQLSHGSNRRKRTTSVSSGSSTGGHSPILTAAIPSPIHEHSPTPSPPGSSGSSYGPISANGVQLPSINGGAGHAHGIDSFSHAASSRLPTILPKPASMTLALVTGAATGGRYMGDTAVAVNGIPPPHSAPLLPAARFTTPTPTSATAPAPLTVTPNLRLDCSGLPPPPPLSSAGPHHPVDMGRLHAVYTAHRTAFWAAIAAEYGQGSHPVVLEQAWRMGGGPSGGPGVFGGLGSSSSSNSSSSSAHHQTATPLTPGTSPDDRDVFYAVKGSQDKTRISAILGIDANPRSPKEREIVRRLEEERVAVPAAA